MALAWSCDPESYACGSVAIGRVCDTGQVEGDDQTKRETLVLQVGVRAWGFQLRPVNILNY
jgi:hypothetical protein